MALGAGRSRAEDSIDPAVGATMQAKPGAAVAAGDPLVVLHYRREPDLGPAVDLVSRAIRIEDEPPAAGPLVRGQVIG
jgi:thymidine phosphorylase